MGDGAYLKGGLTRGVTEVLRKYGLICGGPIRGGGRGGGRLLEIRYDNMKMVVRSKFQK